jgi:hypothetical protein
MLFANPLKRAYASQINALWTLFAILWMCFHIGSAYAKNGAVPLKQPIAYCVSSLNDCTPDKQQPITAALSYDIRSVNGGKNDPITLVYAVPPNLVGREDWRLMVSPSFRDHCFQLDNQRDTTLCSRRSLLTIPIDSDTKTILTQNVQGDDVRL